MSSGMERSIHEMLRDTPSLNESAGAVQTGTPPPHIQKNQLSDVQPRPATMNLSFGSQYSKSRTFFKFSVHICTLNTVKKNKNTYI